MDKPSKAIHAFSVAFLAIAVIGFLGIINNDPISFEPAGRAAQVAIEVDTSCSDACTIDLNQCLDTSDRIFNTCESSGPIAAECFEAGSDYIDGCIALLRACEVAC
jgi:hypothetical protein|tara:strand:+ start:418 stop:735 length:318 start_codon:yes stop_codon:yes gene_type:complete